MITSEKNNITPNVQHIVCSEIYIQTVEYNILFLS